MLVAGMDASILCTSTGCKTTRIRPGSTRLRRPQSGPRPHDGVSVETGTG